MAQPQNWNQALDEVNREKKIPREELVDALEAALTTAYRQGFSTATNVKVELTDAGVKVYELREVVETASDAATQITLDSARKIQPAAALADTVKVEITPRDFGRIAAQTARQVIVQKIREAERRLTFEEFQSRIGEMIVGTLRRFARGDGILDYNGVEVVLPAGEQIPGQRFAVGERVKGAIHAVSRETKGPLVTVSRVSEAFLQRLFEREIPEIREGIVAIKGIVREPGVRSKVAVHSKDARVEAVGACVGLNGSRIQAIGAEAGGEKIDIIPWSEDPSRFIEAALAPARPIKLIQRPGESYVLAVVPEHQLALAIGRERLNVRLASRLTNTRIDITSASAMADANPPREQIDAG